MTTTGTFRSGRDELYYELRGSGPILVFVPGGNGDAGPYAGVAAGLADAFTAVSYDRRGFSRSRDAGVPDGDDERFAAELSDLDALLDAVGAEEPVTVFGSSSGGIIALHYLLARPDRVARTVVHEPPLAPLLPDGEHWLSELSRVHRVYTESGTEAAVDAFATVTGISGSGGQSRLDLPGPLRELIDRMNANWPLFMERELRQYVRRVPDLDALDRLADRVVLAGGVDSRGSFPYRPAEVLAERLDTTVMPFPGDHVGYGPHHAEFATTLRAVLTDAP